MPVWFLLVMIAELGKTYKPIATAKDNTGTPIQLLTCSLCGITSSDVAKKTVYTGGIGNNVIIQCRNETECWERWDKKNVLHIEGLID